MNSLVEVRPNLMLVNGTSGDPSVYYFRQREGAAILFDLGLIDNLTNKDILKVDAVLVSHTHIDHFIGFDRFLRVNIPHFRRRLIFGPMGIATNVAAKMQAYTWNLLDSGQIAFDVVEIQRDGTTRFFEISSDFGFVPAEKSHTEGNANGVTKDFELTPDLRVKGVALDHRIDSIAYRIDGPDRWKVDIDAVLRDGLVPGPWVRQLQLAMGHGTRTEMIPVGSKSIQAQDLAELYLERVSGQAIGYVTDALFNAQNLERCCALFQGIDLLISETCFLAADRSRATAKRHLTAQQAALLAASCGATELINFHVSSIYGKDTDIVGVEAQECFARFRAMSTGELRDAATAEWET